MRTKLKDGTPGPLKLMTKGDDIFGCDLIVMTPFQGLTFVQATRDRSIKKRLEEIKKYPWDTITKYAKVQLWQKVGSRIVKIYGFNGKNLVQVGKIENRKFLVHDKISI